MVQKLKLEHENNNGQKQLCFFYYQVRRFFCKPLERSFSCVKLFLAPIKGALLDGLYPKKYHSALMSLPGWQQGMTNILQQICQNIASLVRPHLHGVVRGRR
jgi:hypothetical protein